jgi:hypothetical protein
MFQFGTQLNWRPEMGFFKKLMKKSVGGKILGKTDPLAKKIMGSDKKSNSGTSVKSALMSKLGNSSVKTGGPAQKTSVPAVGAGSGVGRAQAARNSGLKIGGKKFNRQTP